MKPGRDASPAAIFIGASVSLAHRIVVYLRSVGEEGSVAFSDELPTDFDHCTTTVVLPAADLSDRVEDLIKKGASVIAYGSPLYLRSAFIAGCCDYLRHPWTAEEFWFRLNRICVDRSVSFPWGEIRLDHGRLVSARGIADLSPGQEQLYKLLVRNRGSVVSRTAMLMTLGGAAGSRAADVQVAHLRRKLAAIVPAGVSPPIRTIHNRGYRLD